jgi:uncharacterized protein YlxW (UPF0749 family)
MCVMSLEGVVWENEADRADGERLFHRWQAWEQQRRVELGLQQLSTEVRQLQTEVRQLRTEMNSVKTPLRHLAPGWGG